MSVTDTASIRLKGVFWNNALSPVFVRCPDFTFQNDICSHEQFDEPAARPQEAELALHTWTRRLELQ